MERQRERALEDARGARERALVAVGAELLQRVRADLRLDPLGAQLGEDAVAVVDLDDVGLPAVHVALVGARQQHRQVAQPLGVALGDARARGEQLVEPARLRDPDRAEDVREAVVEPGRRHVGRRRASASRGCAARRDRVGERGVVRRDGAALARRDDLARVEAEAAGDAEPSARAPAVARAERAGGVLEQRQRRAARAAARPAEEVHPEQRFVRGPTSICAGSMFIVSGSTSTSTGRSPRARRRSPSPGRCTPGRAPRRPARARARAPRGGARRCRSETASACSTSQARASSASNSATFGPIVSIPLSSTPATSASSALADVGPA